MSTPEPPRIAPFLEAEARPAERLEGVIHAPTVPAPPATSLGLVFGGLAVMATGISIIGLADFIADQFARGPAMGAAAAAVVLGGGGLLAAGLWREWRGLAALERVDGLRRQLQHADPVQRGRAVGRLVASLAPAERPAGLAALNDPDAQIAMLRAGPIAARHLQADTLARDAALQSMAGLAAMPSPALAALFVAWRGLRLIRSIAVVHGLRPGLAGSLALVRETAISAGAVAGTEMAVNTAAHALLSNPMMQHLAGDMAGAGLAARRLLVLGRAASNACSPLPRD